MDECCLVGFLASRNSLNDRSVLAEDKREIINASTTHPARNNMFLMAAAGKCFGHKIHPQGGSTGSLTPRKNHCGINATLQTMNNTKVSIKDLDHTSTEMSFLAGVCEGSKPPPPTQPLQHAE